VVELGPGDSLGTGFCAPLSGATRFYTLDVVEHCDARCCGLFVQARKRKSSA